MCKQVTLFLHIKMLHKITDKLNLLVQVKSLEIKTFFTKLESSVRSWQCHVIQLNLFTTLRVNMCDHIIFLWFTVELFYIRNVLWLQIISMLTSLRSVFSNYQINKVMAGGYDLYLTTLALTLIYHCIVKGHRNQVFIFIYSYFGYSGTGSQSKHESSEMTL